MKLQHYRDRLLYSLQGWGPYIEVFLITALVIGLSYLFNRNDPFCIHASFPWVWIAPVLVALRYGTLPAIFVIIVMVGAFFLFDPKVAITTSEYRYATFGGLLLTILCGEFNNAWLGAMKRFTQLNGYIQKRLDGLNRAFYLLRISHDRLEQSLISKPVTLRNTLVELKNLLVDAGGECTQKIAEQFLHMLGQYCNMEQAGLYLYQDGKFIKDPIAHVGSKRSELVVDDPMVKECMQSESGINYYAIDQLHQKDRESKYLATVLLRTCDNEICGLLVIEDLAFWSLTQEVLRTLGIISAYFADDIWAVKKMAKFLKVYPDCPPQFVFELKKTQHLYKDFGVESALSAFVILPSARQENIITQLQHMRRGMDIDWHYQQKQRGILFTLMPFSSPVAVAGYRNRFQRYLKSEFGIDLEESKEVYLRNMQIFSGEPLQVVQQLMEYVDAV